MRLPFEGLGEKYHPSSRCHRNVTCHCFNLSTMIVKHYGKTCDLTDELQSILDVRVRHMYTANERHPIVSHAPVESSWWIFTTLLKQVILVLWEPRSSLMRNSAFNPPIYLSVRLYNPSSNLDTPQQKWSLRLHLIGKLVHLMRNEVAKFVVQSCHKQLCMILFLHAITKWVFWVSDWPVSIASRSVDDWSACNIALEEGWVSRLRSTRHPKVIVGDAMTYDVIGTKRRT